MKRTLLYVLPTVALLILLGTSAGSSAADVEEIDALPPVTVTDDRAGTCYSFYPGSGTDRPYMPMAYEAGSRWDRFDFVWPNLEREDGSWKGEALDAYDTLVEDLGGAGFRMVGILLWTPDWAATGGVTALSVPASHERPPGWYAPESGALDTLGPMSATSGSSSPPKGLYQPWDDWTTEDGDPINYWGRFVHKVVERYGDRVKNWEMWNEPEWSYFWTGTSTDYARLLKVGYLATKAACEECQVLFGGLHYWANQDYHKWVLNSLADDPEASANDYFFDVMSIHLYSRSSNAYEVVNEIRSEMKARASDHPIWLTETGVPIWGDGDAPGYKEKYDYAATREEAAAYVLQSYANAWASGVERYFFFRTHDADMTEYFGLIRNDMTLRPSYAAYQVATRHLVSPTMVTRTSYGEGAERVTLWGTPKGKVSVIWNRTPGTFEFDYPAALPTARLIDRRGGERTIEANDGAYKLVLPGATANLVSEPDDYIIGGEPYLVIEEDTVAPSKAVVDALPETSHSSTVTISCGASDAGAGIWGYELEVRKGAGAWKKWGRIHSAPIAYTGAEDGGTYCFRVRAWDRAGNPGPWADREPCTSMELVPELRVEVSTVFGDKDGDGQQDDSESVLGDVSFRLLDGDRRDVVEAVRGPSCAFTTTVDAGDYELVITPGDWPTPPPGWLPWHHAVRVGPGDGTVTLAYDGVGLLPHRTSVYFPITAHDG